MTRFYGVLLGFTVEPLHGTLGVLAAHEGDEAAVAVARLLLLGAWPHDLDAGQRAVLAEGVHQLLLRHLRVDVAQVDVGRVRVAHVERALRLLHCTKASPLDTPAIISADE